MFHRSISARALDTMSALRPLALGFHLALAGVVIATPLQAQDDQTQELQRPATSASEGAAVLEPVEVTAASEGEATEGTQSYTAGAARTATPLRMSLRETPQSVSVVTRQRIEDQDLQTIMDVVSNATGVAVNRYETNRAQFNARGFKINSLMIDNVPTIWEQPWSSGEIFSSLAMYDRVEIVRGANGLMTGAGDPSAAINLVHKRANSQDLKGSVKLSAGSWDTYGAEADVSTALNQSGSVRGRLVGEYQAGDSWIDLHSNERNTIYGTVDIDLGPGTVLWLGASHQENKSNSPMWGGLPVWYSDGTRTDWDRSKTTSAKWSFWDSTYDNYFANLEHAFDNGWLASFGYSRGERKADSYLLYAFGAPNPDTGVLDTPVGAGFYGGSYDVQTDQDDFNVQARGPLQLLGRQHELAFGYTHSKQKFRADTRGYLSAGNADLIHWTGNIAEPAWLAPTFYDAFETTQDGLYGVVRFSLADPLKLVLGYRVSNYEKVDGDGQPLTEVENEQTPYAGFVYDINENISAYVSYTDIFLPQTERDRNGDYLDPIIGKNYETGVKGEFLDGGLNASFAVFRIEQDNLAQSTGDAIDGRPGEFAFVESEGATSKGIEVEVSGKLATGWNASMGYTHFNVRDANGDEINTLYPRNLLRTFTTYRFPGELDKLTVGGGVNWQSDTHTNAANPSGTNERITQKAYSLVNLMARYNVSQQLSLQLNADNVLDEKHFDVFDAYGSVTYGAPRSLTASAKYDF